MAASGKTKNANWFKPIFNNCDERNAKRPRTNRTDDDAKNSIPKNDNIDLMFKDPIVCNASNVSENWLDKFSPKAIADLAVNNKKILEVQEFITKYNHGNTTNKMLLLTGPSGSGKTATVNVLAKHLGMQICEWVTPIDIEYTREFDSTTFSYHEKQSDKFLDFLIKASCYSSLLTANSSRIVLVEDFPNIFLKNTTEFVEILQKYANRGKSPLIFICSDSNAGALNIAWNLFPAHILEKLNIQHISFNPVTNTNMKAALNRILTMMNKNSNASYQKPDQDCLESIVNSSMGDIISAVNNLQYAALKGSVPIQIRKPLPKKPQKGKKVKKKDDAVSKLSTMGKDENISVMHAVGRVLNPKFVEKTEDMQFEKHVHSPSEIVDQFQSQPTSFVGYIFENYLPHFANIEYVDTAADFISTADYLTSEWKENDSKLYGLYVAISGTMVSNKAPVSSWHPIRALKNIKTAQENQEVPLIDRNQLLKRRVLMTDFKTYCNVINTQTTNTTICDDLEEDYLIEEF